MNSDISKNNDNSKISNEPKSPLIRTLKFRRIDKENNEAEYNDLNKSIDISFNDVDNYLKRTINGKKIYIRESFPLKEPTSSFISSPILSRSTMIKNKINNNLKKGNNNSNSTSLLRISENSSKYSSRILPKATKICPFQRNDISDDKIVSLFKSYTTKIGNKKNIKFIYDDLKIKENQKEKYLNLQARILEKQKKEEKFAEKIRNKIHNETKNKNEKLLMDKFNSYRLFKEIKDKTEKNNLKKEATVDKWYLSLREVKNLPGTRKAIMNMGSDNHPRWAIIYQKYPHYDEFIRGDNSIDMSCKRSFLKNSYLKSNPILGEIKRSFSQLDGLCLKGKNLLQEEFDLFTKMKGKKKITNYYQEDNAVEDIVFAENSSNYSHDLGSNLINSCQSLHV